MTLRVYEFTRWIFPLNFRPESDINRPSLPDLQENVPKSTKRLADPVLLKAALEMKNRNERKRLLLNIGIGNLNKLDEKVKRLRPFSGLSKHQLPFLPCRDVATWGLGAATPHPTPTFRTSQNSGKDRSMHRKIR